MDMNMAEDILNFIIDAFQVDKILIIEHDWLSRSVQKRNIQPLPLIKLGSVVPIEAEFKGKMQTNLLSTYFNQFQIHKLTVTFDEIKIYKVIGLTYSASTRMYGDTNKSENLILNQIAPTLDDLLNTILGVLADPEQAMRSSIYGLVHVIEVDEFHQSITLLSPGLLPSKHFILGTVKKLK